MPRAKKYVTKLQPLSGEDLEQSVQKTVIIHPGSRYLRMIRPQDREAVMIPHCIAWRSKSPASSSPSINQEMWGKLDTISSSQSFKQTYAAAETEVKEKSKDSTTGMRFSCSFKVGRVENYDVPCTKPFVAGIEALDIAGIDPNYQLVWPLRCGHFNTHEGAGGSVSAVASDLEHIWDQTLIDELQLKKADRSDYRVVLIVPDIYSREEIRIMVDIILNRLEFFAVFVTLENVASAFGTCLGTACVVDIGAEKTSVSCIDEGTSLPQTRIMLNYGGDDVTRLCHFVLKNKLKNFAMSGKNFVEDMQLDAIKKAMVHYDYGLKGINDFKVDLPSPDREFSVDIRISHDLCRLPGQALFHKELILSPRRVCFSTPNFFHSDDLYSPPYTVDESSSSTYAKDISENEPEIPEETFPNLIVYPFEIGSSSYLPLHRAVLWSISRCGPDELQSRMLKNLLIVGGGFALSPDSALFLKEKIQEELGGSFEVEIAVNEREVPLDLHALKGGTVIAGMETVQFLWITKEEWNKNGIKVLREKSSFPW